MAILAAMSKLQLSIALPDYDHVRDLMTGRIAAEGLDLACLTLPVEEIFYRFLMHREFDVAEVSFAKYAALHAEGNDALIALPVFPSRVFRHGSLFVRKDGPVKKITDLSGRKVGLPEWAQTAAVYSRGFLQHQYGIDLASIHWVQAGTNDPGRKEKVELNLPAGIRVERIGDRSLNEMLLAGDTDAVLSARPPAAFTAGDPRIVRFFDDLETVEAEYYRATGIFPIMHTVAVRKEVLEKNPWIARSLFTAFEEARRRSLERAFDPTVSMLPIPWGYEYARRAKALLGDDYFPYGIDANRRTLDAFLAYAHEQGVCKRRLTVDELFPKQMMSSYKV
jgi:4,5-dihydroxyphthalate decarboxylase